MDGQALFDMLLENLVDTPGSLKELRIVGGKSRIVHE